jgi:cytochrome bd ubiquinol oxidase subunit II
MTAADPSWLAQYWAAVLFLALFVYVTLDGFDLGVGILFGTTRDHELRSEMMGAISPFWNGNETWLIVVGATLFAAFPAVYAVFLAAFYIPVLLLLVGLIFRGVAFEFRGRGGPSWIWDWGFFLGSTIVAFVQGAAVGALMDGVKVHDSQFAGGSFDWLRPFPVWCGVGLVFGYAVLGAGWLVLKSEGELRDWAYARIPWLVGITASLLGLAGVVALVKLGAHAPQHLTRPWAMLFPALSWVAALGTFAGVRLRRDGMPFAMATLSFAAAFLTVPALFWPYMSPYQLTVAHAASPDASLSFLFWGAGLVALPVVGAYTGYIYWSFRGKLRKGYA